MPRTDRRVLCGRRPMAAAFSLLELIVAMSVLSLITLTLYGVYNQVAQTWGEMDNEIAVYQNANLLLEFLERDLSAAVVDPEVGFYVVDRWNNDPMLRNITFAGKADLRLGADQLYFASGNVPIEPVQQLGGSPMMEVGYELWGTTTVTNQPYRMSLVRLTTVKNGVVHYNIFNDEPGKEWWIGEKTSIYPDVYPNDASNYGFDQWEPWADLVCGFNVVCYDEEGRAYEEWPPNNESRENWPAPTMVEITITMTTPRTWNELQELENENVRRELLLNSLRSFTTRLYLPVEGE
ncbi:MAG: prepilin-type N-terminal cleavage/methylation domain-containing protein [Verrucomicrobiota bacterium]|nr:prepilin-type N-terminal cleavage/methylation domain-containing protein [Verrucomicrobiota bacterium]